MHPSSPAPSETDVLRAIGDLLTAKHSSAALAHYPTLRIQTNHLHHALTKAIGQGSNVIDQWSAMLSNDAEVAFEFQQPSSIRFAYRMVLPALIRNLHQTADFLLEVTQAAPPVDVDRVGETTPSFSDFVKLGSAVRGFLDALTQAAYQLITFDGRQLNYKFLQSLLSFAPVAPPSLHTNIVSPELQTALDAFIALPKKDRKNSSFTKAAHEQFPQRLAVACQFARLPDWRRQNLELTFNFCSDFVHSGYISVLAISAEDSGLITGGPGDAFTPKAENFAELKQRLLAECAGAYADLLWPALRHGIGQTLALGLPIVWAEKLDAASRKISDVRSVLNRRLVEPVRQGLTNSEATIRIDCMCGGQVDLCPPHHEWERFCPDCGSRFVLHEVGEEVDYVVSASGIGDILGGDAVKIDQLDSEARAKLNRIAAKHAPQKSADEVAFLLITDLANCDEETLEAPTQIRGVPRKDLRDRCSIFAFVAAKSLERCTTIRIQCNCGAHVDYETALCTNVCLCLQCRTQIGLFGVTGDGTKIRIVNPDGTPGTAPIQARNRFTKPGTGVN